jgi:hypothetical protein
VEPPKNPTALANLPPASAQSLEKQAAPAADPLAWLEKPEREALDYFVKNRNLPGSRYAPISASVALGMFNLYLNGRSIREIWDMNRAAFGFGQVVHAAVEGNWFEHKAKYLEGLFESAALRAKQAVAEGAEFTADMMAAAHKLHGMAIRKFLQTGNIEDLGAMGITSLRQYKELIEIHMKLTGQDKVQKVGGTIKHEHSHTIRVPTAPPPEVPAASTLGFLSAWGKEELDKQNGKDKT